MNGLAEECFNVGQCRRAPVLWQAAEEYFSVWLLEDAIVEQCENAAIVERADQASKALFKRDYRGRNLIVIEGVSAFVIDGIHARFDDWVAWDREWQAVDDYAAQLLALHVHALPE